MLSVHSLTRMTAAGAGRHGLLTTTAATSSRRHGVLATRMALRSFSSGMSKDDGEKRSPRELTPYQKLQKWLQPFVAGSRALVAENRQAWQVRKRMKAAAAAGNDNGKGQSVELTRREMLVLRQAHRDLVKSLPVLLFFCVPLLGYAAPVLGYQFPKQLLPWQFWRADQKTQFLQEDARARAACYPELVQLLAQMDRKHACLAQMLACHEKGEGLNPAQVAELQPFFETEAQGPAALPALAPQHVHLLARSIALMPAFAWAQQLMPRAFLVRHMERRMEELRVDDALLLREGIESLSLDELEFACEERGIVDGYGEIEKLQRALGDWLAIYPTDTAGTPVAVPYPTSLLLHAPALLNPTGRAGGAQA